MVFLEGSAPALPKILLLNNHIPNSALNIALRKQNHATEFNP
jgi:hypothetical protein